MEAAGPLLAAEVKRHAGHHCNAGHKGGHGDQHNAGGRKAVWLGCVSGDQEVRGGDDTVVVRVIAVEGLDSLAGGETRLQRKKQTKEMLVLVFLFTVFLLFFFFLRRVYPSDEFSRADGGAVVSVHLHKVLPLGTDAGAVVHEGEGVLQVAHGRVEEAHVAVGLPVGAAHWDVLLSAHHVALTCRWQCKAWLLRKRERRERKKQKKRRRDCYSRRDRCGRP